MNKFIVSIFLIILATKLLGQSFFIAEGTQIKTCSSTKTYNFIYQFQDSLSIIFTDSIETFFNNDSSIVKSTTYSKFNKRPSTRLEYFRKNKEDSISKHFLGDTLRCIYETRFDSSDRIVYYALKNYYPDSSSGFEWNYEYRDSLLNTGKVLIQTIFVTDDFNVRQFHFRVLSIYDGKNRKIKEIRESKTNDPWAQITTYIYNDKDSVVEERVFTAGIENVFSNQKSPKNTKCWQENETTIPSLKFNDIKLLIERMLNENKKILTNNRCDNLVYKYFSQDRQIELIIRKVKPYWEGGRSVTYKISQKY